MRDIQASRLGTLTDASGSLADGSAHTVLNANKARRYLLIQNLGAAVLWVNFTTTAVASQPSIALKACAADNDGSGGVLVMDGLFCTTEPVSIIGTSGKAYVVKEG